MAAKVPIPASVFKSTMFFADPGTRLAWSESYFTQGSATLGQVFSNAVALCNIRQGMNHPDVQCIGLRSSDENVQRDAILSQGGQNTIQTNGSLPIGVNESPAVPWTTFFTRDEFVGGYHSQRYLSGFRANLIQDPVFKNPSPDYAAAFKVYADALLTGKGMPNANLPWGNLVLSNAGADRNTQTLQNYTSGVGNTLTLNVLQLGTFAVGDVVKVYGANWVKKPIGNGYAIITGIAAAGNQLTCLAPTTRQGTWLDGGTVQRLRFIFVAYTDIIIRGETHRDRGGRVFLPRGRQRNRI
jgi:hypothetical protein